MEQIYFFLDKMLLGICLFGCETFFFHSFGCENAVFVNLVVKMLLIFCSNQSLGYI